MKIKRAIGSQACSCCIVWLLLQDNGTLGMVWARKEVEIKHQEEDNEYMDVRINGVGGVSW